MTQLTFSSNLYWKICFKFCILEQIIATVLFICISSINNKRSLLRFQSTTAPTNRGCSACDDTRSKQPCSCFQVTFVQRSTKEGVTPSINIRQNRTCEAKNSVGGTSFCATLKTINAALAIMALTNRFLRPLQLFFNPSFVRASSPQCQVRVINLLYINKYV